MQARIERRPLTTPSTPSAADASGAVVRWSLRARWEPQALDRVRRWAAGPDVNWDEFCRTAEREEIAPLLFNALRERAILPTAVEEKLASAYHAAGARNTILLHALEQDLQRMNEKGVRVLLLKGAALLGTVYRNPALRPMDDVDWLVRREDFAPVLRELTEIGYVAQRTGTRAEADVTQENEVELFKPGVMDVALDLHWNWIDSPYYPHRRIVDWLWGRAEPIAIGRSSAMVLCPEAQVLHLCVHFMIDGGRRPLLRLHDIAEVIQRFRGQLDWDEIVRQAQAFELVSPLRSVLNRAVEEWEIPIPAPARQRLEEIRPSPAETRFYDWLAAGERQSLELYASNLAALASPRARLGYILRSLFPPPRYLQKLYGVRSGLLVPWLYPYRWLRGLVQAAGTRIHHARNHVLTN